MVEPQGGTEGMLGDDLFGHGVVGPAPDPDVDRRIRDDALQRVVSEVLGVAPPTCTSRTTARLAERNLTTPRLEYEPPVNSAAH